MRIDAVAESVQFSPGIYDGKIGHLEAELSRYRRINDLYCRLAAAADVASMIEHISSWLMPTAEHDLICFHDHKANRTATFCSCHGSRKEAVEKAVDRRDTAGGGERTVFSCPLPLGAASATLTLLRCEHEIIINDQELIREAMRAVSRPLKRALAHEDLFDLARRDALTGLANRRVFAEHMPPLMARSLRQSTDLSLMCLDLDHFKDINDSLGHPEGDRVLLMVAGAFADQIRESDILARMGGDEFSILLPDTSAADSVILGERLCQVVSDLALSDGRGHRLGVSIGIAQLQPGMSAADWQRLADETLYRAKNSGRARVCVAAGSVHYQSVEKRTGMRRMDVPPISPG